MREHASYEKAVPPPADLAVRLEPLLVGAKPRLICFVGASNAGDVVGYATATVQLSSWQASEFLHLDCLFLREHARGHGLGPLLMAAVTGEAAARGLATIEWQTPGWNEGAIRFYDRFGSTRAAKQRYTLAV